MMTTTEIETMRNAAAKVRSMGLGVRIWWTDLAVYDAEGSFLGTVAADGRNTSKYAPLRRHERLFRELSRVLGAA